MLTIRIFRLTHGLNEIHTSGHARFLSVGVDFEGRVCAWAVVDTEAPKYRRVLHTVGTGDPLPLAIWDDNRLVSGVRFLGTATAKHGETLHIFDLGVA